jgi:uncharacterized membrane protein YfcA
LRLQWLLADRIKPTVIHSASLGLFSQSKTPMEAVKRLLKVRSPLLGIRNQATLLLLLPLVPLGVYLDSNLLTKLKQNTFNLVMAWSLLAVGLKLMFDGAQTFL